MINILFIAFEFPPLNRGGVFRPLSFVKYLPQFGINPVVVTLDPNSYADVFDLFTCDKSLGDGFLEGATIVPITAEKSKPLSRWKQFTSIYFSIHGNEARYWKKAFNESIDNVIATYSPKVILATVPPFSVLPLAEKIAKKHKLPLILDFRDAWSQWRTLPYGTIFHYWRTLHLEGRYFRHANAIIATSGQTIDDFKKLHQNIPASKFHYVPNGYNGTLQPWCPIRTGKDEYTIGYVGSFYFTHMARAQMLKPWWRKKGHRMLQYIPRKQDWLYRSPYFFFKCLQALNRRNPNLGNRIKVKFAGKKVSWLEDMIASFDLQQQVFQIGELPHQESLHFQQQCDALLVTSAKHLGGRDYSVAGKTFEYIEMQKPVISFACEGAQKDLLLETGLALICDPDDTDTSSRSLADLFEGRKDLHPNFEFLSTLSRSRLIERLAKIIKTQIKE